MKIYRELKGRTLYRIDNTVYPFPSKASELIRSYYPHLNDQQVISFMKLAKELKFCLKHFVQAGFEEFDCKKCGLKSKKEFR